MNLEIAGFIDLSALALVAGYQMNARGMTLMWVQVLWALLNKCDNKWGYRWSDIPQALQVYGLGNLKFGHLTFIVLTGILVRDLFPDPDIVCQFLNGNQWQGVTWFYEWILKSLGVKVQEQDARKALTRSQMIPSLRYQDERSKLSKIPPPWIVLWSRMIGPPRCTPPSPPPNLPWLWCLHWYTLTLQHEFLQLLMLQTLTWELFFSS